MFSMSVASARTVHEKIPRRGASLGDAAVLSSDQLIDSDQKALSSANRLSAMVANAAEEDAIQVSL